jgi:LmbE family N-acetylglucosaminyl deacetylase
MIQTSRLPRALVLSPHPDDESIGCGGTLREHVLAGETVRAIFLTSGENGGHGTPPEQAAATREQEARDAATILGLENVDFWREPDGALRSTPRLIRRLTEVLRDFQPRILYMPHPADDHPDHKAAAFLAIKAVEALADGGANVPAPELWMYEIWTPIQHIDQIVDISASIETKLAAIRAHRSQCREMRFDEACRGLARYRGEMHCWPGGDYAEAFAEWRPSPQESTAETAAHRSTSAVGGRS